MKRIFVVSRLRADTREGLAQNIARAERLCHIVADLGHAPFAPHLLYTRFLDDTVPAEREMGIACGKAWLAVCDEVWVDAARGISEGMAGEIEDAKALGKPVVYPAWSTLEPE